VASQVAAITALIYLIGWGPALAIGYGFAILNNAFHVGARSRWALVVWPIVGLAAAQGVVDLFHLRLLLSRGEADGLAAVDAAAIFFVALFVAQLVAGKEAAERKLSHAASHDHLTGLMNRSSFIIRLDRRLRGIRQDDERRRPVAVLFCDLVGFKEVNDRFGHETGDAVLAEVAHRLALTVRDGDLLARFAGDEFVVGLYPVERSRDAVATAERLLAAFDRPVEVAGRVIRVGMSVGIVFSPSGRPGVEDLLAQADGAMYEAKAARRSAWALLEIA
jgi:diguanylate cyclase (GGDEF)-like protein